MSAEEIIVVASRLSRRLSVEINLSRSGRMHCIWAPSLPSRLTRKEMRAYEKARDEAATKLGELLGGSVLVLTL